LDLVTVPGQLRAHSRSVAQSNGKAAQIQPRVETNGDRQRLDGISGNETQNIFRVLADGL